MWLRAICSSTEGHTSACRRRYSSSAPGRSRTTWAWICGTRRTVPAPALSGDAEVGEGGGDAAVLARLVAQVELEEDPADVGFHGLEGHDQALGDRPVGQPFGDQAQDLVLALGQLLQGSAGALRPPAERQDRVPAGQAVQRHVALGAEP